MQTRRLLPLVMSLFLGLAAPWTGCGQPDDDGPCVGLDETRDATSAPDGDATPAATAETDAGADTIEVCPTCPGARLSAVELEDIQPSSCLFGTRYGLDVFRGRTTVVALFAAW